MKKVSLIWLLAFSCLAFQACDQTGNKRTSGDTVEDAHDANDEKEGEGGAKDETNDFAVKAVASGITESQLSQLAQENTQNPEVKALAAQMIQHHTQANQELKALATLKNITLPSELGKEGKESVDKLGQLSGKEFDKKYVDLLVEDHEKDVKLFEEATESDDAQIKAFASKQLPVLRKHLDQVKALDEKLE